MDQLADRPRNITSEYAGPREALRRLQLGDLTFQERVVWRENARIDAILGSCRLSLKSVRSGIRHWFAYIDSVHQGRIRYFPPACADILAWSTLFRSVGTWNNYLNYLRTGCMLVQASTEVFSDPAVRRTTTSVLKAGNFVARDRMWIRREQIEQLVGLGGAMTFGSGRFLFLITYIFLLRLPSEALPLTIGKDTSRNEIFVEDEALVIVLARRKNKANGSRLSRRCWCSRSRTTCPVHVVGSMLSRLAHGTKLFVGWTPSTALCELRELLEIIGVASAQLYRCHDIRRGHALDLQLAGAPLHEILAAGEWRSPAFLEYLDRHALERDMVHEAQQGLTNALDSDDEN